MDNLTTMNDLAWWFMDNLTIMNDLATSRFGMIA